MRQFLLAGLLALTTSPFIGCCSTTTCLSPGGGLAGVGCATGGCAPGLGMPGCGAPNAGLGAGCATQAMLPALPPVGFSSGDCNANCDATMTQGYLHGFSFGNAVSCGVKQVLAVPLAAATFVGGTAEALLGGIGSCATLNLAQTTSTLSSNYGSNYAQSPCTCDACESSASIVPHLLPSTTTQSCPCAAPTVMNSMPVQSYSAPPAVMSPGLPPALPTYDGGVQMAPMSHPIAVPLPRDANNGTQSTTYAFPNSSPVMATAF